LNDIRPARARVGGAPDSCGGRGISSHTYSVSEFILLIDFESCWSRRVSDAQTLSENAFVLCGHSNAALHGSRYRTAD
jgi:hypothetical protein